MKAVCPCGSGLVLAGCCGRYIEGLSAPDAETLMRSRYTAYVLARHDYLFATWHPATRPEAGSMGGTTLRWIGLQIVHAEAGGPADANGVVEFIASYVDRGKGKRLFERSHFVCEAGRWFYVDGDCRVEVIGRNDPCPCGSGRKFKQCCGKTA